MNKIIRRSLALLAGLLLLLTAYTYWERKQNGIKHGDRARLRSIQIETADAADTTSN